MLSCRPLFVGGITLKVEMLHKFKIWKWWKSKSHNPKPFERQIQDTAKHLLWLTLAVRYIAPLCICMPTKYLKSTLTYLLSKSILLSWLLFLSAFLMFWVLAQNSTWFSTSFSLPLIAKMRGGDKVGSKWSYSLFVVIIFVMLDTLVFSVTRN